MANILIVYYSRKGENYWNGGLKTIAKGNTAIPSELPNSFRTLWEASSLRSIR